MRPFTLWLENMPICNKEKVGVDYEVENKFFLNYVEASEPFSISMR